MAGTEGGGGGTSAIGIDLGTTYSCVGVYQRGKVEIIVNAQGNRTTPSCVAFTHEDCLVGDAARNQAVRNPSNTVFDAKRLIGRKFSDPIVQNDIKLWPFKVEAGPNDKPMISVQYKGEAKRFSAEDVSAIVLTEMREIAEAYLATPVSKAVVTVPAYFNNSQRHATREAGVIAGLDVIRVINEPTAAAIAYGLEDKAAVAADTARKKKKKNVLIFDLGGGTFDVSLVAIDVGGALKVIATAGDSHLGGIDFDGRLVDHCVEEFRSRHGKDVSGDPRALRRLRNACEKAKCILSFTVETTIELDYLYDGVDFLSTISAAKFEQLNADLFDRCMDLVESCLNDANTQKSQVHEVVLVGGSTRIPKIQELLQGSFQGSKICKGINPDEAVACGAAIHAAVLAGEESMRMTFEDVAAAVFEDVTPLSLGVGIAGGIMSVLIPKNTPIPTRREKIFTTSYDLQPCIKFSVYEGERTVAKENDLIGEFELSGMPPAPKLVPKIPVTFEINADGMLVVSAENADTHGKANITISAKGSGGSGWSGKKEANGAEENDNRNLEEAITRALECRLRLESYAHDLRNMIRDETTGRKLISSDRKKMEDGIDEVLRWLQNNESARMDEFDNKRSELELLWTTVVCRNNVNGNVSGEDRIVSTKPWFCCW